MLYSIVIVLLLLIVCVVIYLATLNGNYTIRRTQLINTSIETVFDKVIDFKSWPEWSPWLIHEPETQLVYSENYDEEQGSYTWEGQRVGAGKLTHIKLQRPYHIEQRLEFIKPFKSICDVGFEFAEKEGQTEVTWVMTGKMPFFLRFLTEKTRDMISKDYDFGLAMLNGVLDPEAEHPVLQFEDEITLEPVYALCEGFSGELKNMEETMKQCFPKLLSFAEQHGQITGAHFTAYHKVDLNKLYFDIDMAVPVAEGIKADGYQLKSLGGGRYYKVTLSGSYQFLELAWYSAVAHVQMLKLKYDKKRCSLEVYQNDPEQVQSTNEIMTTLYIPIK